MNMRKCAAGSRKEKNAGDRESGSAGGINFIQQKLYGIALLLLTIVVCVFTGDATIAVITVPLGLTLVASKKMWLINDYYREMEQRGRI